MITVIRDDGQHSLNGRLEAIVDFLIDHQEELMEPLNVQIEFNCNQVAIVPNVKRGYPAVSAS